MISPVVEQQAELIARSTLGVLYDALGVTPAAEDDIAAVTAALAEELDMWLSASVVMPELAYRNILEES